MAFTNTEIRYIYEILETPYSTSFYTLDGMGEIGALTDISNGSTGQAYTQINTWLAAMDATSITVVQALILEWIPVRFATTSLVQGSVGANSVTGANYDPGQKRHQIQSIMQTYVPFFKFHEVLARRAGSSRSMSIPAVW